MPALDFAGDYGSDSRPARNGSGRKSWAKDPTGASASDGTRLDATFVNDLVGMIRAAATAYSVTQTPGDDDLLADILAAAIATRAPLASPTFTGTPAAPTATPGTDTTQIATTAFVQAAVAALVNAAPGALDTLDELAAALGDDANYAATVTASLAGKQPLHANLTQLSALTDPNADRLLFWDDSAGGYAHLTLGTNLSITGTTINASGGSSQWTTTGSDIYYTTGKVGVGTNAPATALDFGVGYANVAQIINLYTSSNRRSGIGMDAASSALRIYSSTADAKALSVGTISNTDGTTWAELLAILASGSLNAVSGSAGAPTYSFTADPDSGIYSPGANEVGIAVGGVGKWKVNSSGHLVPVTSNSANVGNNSPAALVAAFHGYWYWSKTNVTGYGWDGGSSIMNPSDGVFTLFNNGSTSFGRLQFGGTTSSFPALKRSSATLQARLADDSAFAEFKASILEAGTSVKFPDATTQTTAFAPYTGSTEGETVLPIGHVVIVDTVSAVAKNSTTTLYAGNAGTGSDSRYNIGATGSALSGTWRARGSVAGYTIYQRVA